MKKLWLAALMGLTACATITKDTDQVIHVNTTPPGAHCTLSNTLGMWEIARTPGETTVQRSVSPLLIQCGEAHVTLPSKTRGRAYGNILLGGVPAIVDAGTGAGYEYFQDTVTLQLPPQH